MIKYKVLINFLNWVLLFNVKDVCGCDKLFNEQSGFISSPNYPFRYQNNLNCHYKFLFNLHEDQNLVLNEESNFKLCFTFKLFKLESTTPFCSYDYLKFESFYEDIKYCGSGCWQYGIEDERNSLSNVWSNNFCWPLYENYFSIQFFTDNSTSDVGFYAAYYLLNDLINVNNNNDKESVNFTGDVLLACNFSQLNFHDFCNISIGKWILASDAELEHFIEDHTTSNYTGSFLIKTNKNEIFSLATNEINFKPNLNYCLSFWYVSIESALPKLNVILNNTTYQVIKGTHGSDSNYDADDTIKKKTYFTETHLNNFTSVNQSITHDWKLVSMTLSGTEKTSVVIVTDKDNSNEIADVNGVYLALDDISIIAGSCYEEISMNDIKSTMKTRFATEEIPAPTASSILFNSSHFNGTHPTFESIKHNDSLKIGFITSGSIVLIVIIVMTIILSSKTYMKHKKEGKNKSFGNSFHDCQNLYEMPISEWHYKMRYIRNLFQSKSSLPANDEFDISYKLHLNHNQGPHSSIMENQTTVEPNQNDKTYEEIPNIYFVSSNSFDDCKNYRLNNSNNSLSENNVISDGLYV